MLKRSRTRVQHALERVTHAWCVHSVTDVPVFVCLFVSCHSQIVSGSGSGAAAGPPLSSGGEIE